MSEVCLFGGSFDPVHRGHIAMARAALDLGGVTKVIVLPAATPPHKVGALQAPAADRLEMARLAFAELNRVEVSERELKRGGLSYTVDTVQSFRSELGSDVGICWLLGADSLPQLPTWRECHRLLAMCRILIIPRTGFPTTLPQELGTIFDDSEKAKLAAGFLAMPPVDISSTELRARLGEGGELTELVPAPVIAWIKQNRLYQRSAP